MTIFFPDVSNIGNAGLHLSSVPVVIAKGTEGSTFTDPSYSDFKRQANQISAFFVAYHWLHPANLLAQATHCFSVVGASTPLMLDVENMTGTVHVSDIVGFVNEYRNLGGHVSLMYIPFWYWRDHMGSPDLTGLQAMGLYLVASDYRRYDETKWPAAYGGVTPYQWQFTSTYSYGGQHCDWNGVRDTLEGYISKIGLPAPKVYSQKARGVEMYFMQIAGQATVYKCENGKRTPLPGYTSTKVEVWGKIVRPAIAAGIPMFTVPDAASADLIAPLA